MAGHQQVRGKWRTQYARYGNKCIVALGLLMAVTGMALIISGMQPKAAPVTPGGGTGPSRGAVSALRKSARPAKRRSSTTSGCPMLRVPKVALMFLTRGDMPHEASWAAWLRSAEGMVPIDPAQNALCAHKPDPGKCPWANGVRQSPMGPMGQFLYSVYVHSGPGYRGYKEDSLFHGREVPDRVQVRWGEHSMVEALRALIREALRDPMNQRFQLLCEYSLPLQSPLLVYQQFIKEPKSRLNACNTWDWQEHRTNSSRDRWTPKMLPTIPEALWRKSSQWVELTRPHAMRIAEDTAVDAVIKKHCTVGYDRKLRRKRDCYSDEHYVPTLMAYLGLDNETTCSGNTMHVSWQSSSGKYLGEHPMSYSTKSVTLGVFLWLRQAGNNELLCNEVSTIRSVGAMFVHQKELRYFSCERAAQLTWDASILEACPLFSRKFGPRTAHMATDLLTSCEPYLGIAPQSNCELWA
ncbi:hypothetical protein CVIRNUC_002605 [Coccomyxa viridis]|uniref:Uncharacterized protein n=1 Tax=Coccomyxa viridis TaxID=1274662 RepID=A0AAV1HWP0_9CHLO|nr:hypothetical protein CVIRNUC_002605 [Coccomyxa viridis]